MGRIKQYSKKAKHSKKSKSSKKNRKDSDMMDEDALDFNSELQQTHSNEALSVGKKKQIFKKEKAKGIK